MAQLAYLHMSHEKVCEHTHQRTNGVNPSEAVCCNKARKSCLCPAQLDPSAVSQAQLHTVLSFCAWIATHSLSLLWPPETKHTHPVMAHAHANHEVRSRGKCPSHAPVAYSPHLQAYWSHEVVCNSHLKSAKGMLSCQGIKGVRACKRWPVLQHNRAT